MFTDSKTRQNYGRKAAAILYPVKLQIDLKKGNKKSPWIKGFTLLQNLKTDIEIIVILS